MTPPAETLDPGAASRCAYRTVLEHDPLAEVPVRGGVDDAVARRRVRAAAEHRAMVVTRVLRALEGLAVDASHDEATTLASTTSGAAVIVRPRLPADVTGRRHGAPSMLVAHHGADGAMWLPVDVHNHFITDEGTRDFAASPLERPWPDDASVVTGRRLRRGGAWRRDLLRLAHHHRILEAHGLSSAHDRRVGIVDRSSVLWWLSLDDPFEGQRSAIDQYDVRFAERRTLLELVERRGTDPSLARPGSPWWHQECPSCPFAADCHHQLSANDDVSLVHYTDAAAQDLLRGHGVTTRRQLAALDRAEVAAGLATADEPSDPTTPTAIALGRRLQDLDRLVRRARVDVSGSLLRLVDADALDACRADVEIDIDMESYDNATYLWGAAVSGLSLPAGVDPGYRHFVHWDELTDDAEGALFGRFFAWLAATVAAAELAGRSVRIYCFWEHAELSQMRRAMATDVASLPTRAQLDEVLTRLTDVHRLVATQIQTGGPAGLKVMASAAGFAWRDDDPSGEASMTWYETATGDDANAARAARTRLLEYNEDDCRATHALRDWLEGPARELLSLEGARPPAS